MVKNIQFNPFRQVASISGRTIVAIALSSTTVLALVLSGKALDANISISNPHNIERMPLADAVFREY
jgi:hypothetical protein